MTTKPRSRPAGRSRVRSAKPSTRPVRRTVSASPASPKGGSNGRLVTLRTNGQITLPAALRDRVGARTGDVFFADVEDDVVVLRPKKLIDSSQAWFWTAEWQKGEREADADIKAGRVYRAKDVKELIASLKR